MNVTNSEDALKNYCKSKGYEKPVYTIISRDAATVESTYRPKYYCCSVKVNGHHLANGDGFSKRIARKKAAMYGLQNLRLLEMTHFFSVFNDYLSPINQRAIGHPSFEQHRKWSTSTLSPSIEIEEFLTIDNQCTSQPLQQTPGSSRKLIKNDNPSSDDLIMAAIAKLRRYSQDDGASEESEQNLKIQEQSEPVKSNQNSTTKKRIIILNEQHEEEDRVENYQDEQQQKIKEITDEIKSLDLNNNIPTPPPPPPALETQSYNQTHSNFYQIYRVHENIPEEDETTSMDDQTPTLHYIDDDIKQNHSWLYKQINPQGEMVSTSFINNGKDKNLEQKPDTIKKNESIQIKKIIKEHRPQKTEQPTFRKQITKKIFKI